MTPKIYRLFLKSLSQNVNANILMYLAMKSIKSKDILHRCLPNNSSVTWSKTFPNKSKSTLNCSTLILMIPTHSKTQGKLLWNQWSGCTKKDNKQSTIQRFKRWPLIQTWWHPWMALLFTKWIFKRTSISLTWVVRLSKNNRYQPLISQSCKLREALCNPQWILRGAALIKLMILLIKVKQVEAVKSRKRKKKKGERVPPKIWI